MNLTNTPPRDPSDVNWHRLGLLVCVLSALVSCAVLMLLWAAA